MQASITPAHTQSHQGKCEENCSIFTSIQSCNTFTCRRCGDTTSNKQSPPMRLYMHFCSVGTSIMQQMVSRAFSTILTHAQYPTAGYQSDRHEACAHSKNSSRRQTLISYPHHKCWYQRCREAEGLTQLFAITNAIAAAKGMPVSCRRMQPLQHSSTDCAVMTTTPVCSI